MAATVPPHTLTRIVLRPIGSPLPLGFFAFGTGSALLTALEAHLIPTSEARPLAFVMLGLVAPLELLPSVLAFLSRDTAAATLLGIFGCLWVVSGLGFLTAGAESRTATMGVLYAVLALALAISGVVALAGKPFFSAILFLATVRLGLLAADQLGAPHGLMPVSAAVGGLLTALAYYGAAALLVEDVRHRSVLPMFRRGAAQRSFEGGLEQQVADVHREAGVREQL